MSVITLFRNQATPFASKPLLTILQQIKKGLHREGVVKLRQYYEEDRDSAFDQQKRLLLSFSVCGNFKLVKERLHLISYSKYLFFEIPYLSEIDLKSVQSIAHKNPYIFSCFKNALGIGLIVIVKIECELEDHSKAFHLLKRHYQEVLGTDRICDRGADPMDLCLFSFDPELYLNLEAVAFPFKP